MSTNGSKPLLRVQDLQKLFYSGSKGLRRSPTTVVRAVENVSFEIARGESFGLVGETGCGKSTVARCVLRLVEPTSGRVTFDGIDVLDLDNAAVRRLRRRMQLVFQDPTGSLDPRMTVQAIVEEPLKIHGIGSRAERAVRAAEMLKLVALDETMLRRKPHEFSGGQRQRIAIARALVLDPSLVVLDEPVSALDVSIQAQVLNLLREVQRKLTLTYMFIVHDLAVAEYFCDRLAVLYLGRVMELGTREQLFRRPLHPYTVALLSAVPVPDPSAHKRSGRIVLQGEVTHGEGTGRGCPFRPRCPVGRDRTICRDQMPPLAAANRSQLVACHFPGELTPVARPL